MDMKVDSKLIRRLREQRAWSQEHLAEVTGLGLRTIQRIESTGAAAYESARALAAVLEIDVARLRVADPLEGESRAARAAAAPAPAAAPAHPHRRFHLRAAPPWLRPAMVGAAVLAVGGALLLARNGFADQIQLDVGVSIDDQEWERRMVVDEGALVPNVTRDGALRFEIIPTIEKGGIMLAMKLLLREGDKYVLIGSPRLLARDGEEVEVRFTTDDGKAFQIVMTPRSNPTEFPKQLQEHR
jgi:transcriptional regulator with XRE-family HTH domain